MRKIISLVFLLCAAAPSYAQQFTQRVTLGAQGASSPQLIDLDHFSGYIGLLCTVAAGSSLIYSVQVSGDPQNPPSGMSNWNDHDTITGLTASANGNIAFPVTAWRLNVSSYTSGSVVCSAIKANTTYQFQWYQKGNQNP